MALIAGCGFSSDDLADARENPLHVDAPVGVADAHVFDARPNQADAAVVVVIDGRIVVADARLEIDAAISRPDAHAVGIDGQLANSDAAVAAIDGQLANSDAAVAAIDGHAANSDAADAAIDGHAASSDAAVAVFDAPVVDASVAIPDADTTDAFIADATVIDAVPWNPIVPSPVATRPTRRQRSVMVYDSADDDVVMFGGTDESFTDLNETWLWDGSEWTEASPIFSPAARTNHCMIDSSFGLLLFGGSVNYNNVNDLWTWNGSNWSPVVTPHSPEPLLEPACTFDSARNKLVVYGASTVTGNYVRETWEYDGNDWTQITTAHVPTSIAGQALAFDPTRNRTVMAGGNAASDEIWEYDGTDWTQFFATGDFSISSIQATMVWDPVRLKITIFDGSGYNSPGVSNVMTWDGTSLVTVPTATTVPTRDRAAVAYDAARNEVVVFGGVEIDFNNLRGDTWTLDANDWTDRQNAATPLITYLYKTIYFDSNRQVWVFVTEGGDDIWSWNGSAWANDFQANAYIGSGESSTAYDSDRQRLVLFSYSQVDDQSPVTAEWDGASWTILSPVHSPPMQARAAMAFDPVHHVIVAFGGIGNNCPDYFCNSTWTWNGTDWTDVSPASSPPERQQASLAFDVARGKMVLYGGGLSDVWEWDGAAWTNVTPTDGPTPGPVSATPLIYNSDTQRVMLYAQSDRAGDVVDGLWSWDGTSWTGFSTQLPSDYRSAPAMWFDPVLHEVDLYGGAEDFDIWTFSSTGP